jgi:P-type Ca2+ transporter type 2C
MQVIAPITPVHTSVPGRARLKVAGLRGSLALKDRLERGCSAAPGVRSVTASGLTGNVLVEFDPTMCLDRIVDHLARLLRGDTVASDNGPIDRGPAWHAISAKRVSSRLKVSPDKGLSRQEARRQLAKAGPNVLGTVPPRSSASIFAGQFQSLPVAMLFGAAAISLVTGGLLEAAAILTVVGINAVIGYQTESQSERIIQSLGVEGPRTAKVTRDGTTSAVPVTQLVPADVLSLRRGDVVPADARLVEAAAFTVSEAILTGESTPVPKSAAALRAAKLPLGARSNMVYRGTIVTGGSGRAIVVATGPRTEAGRIQQLVGLTATPETPLQRALGGLGQRLGWLTLGACTFLVFLGWARGFGLLQMARSALSVAVAAVPEGLPMVATTTLAVGIEKLRRQRVLVRKLDAIETLAAAKVACFDKTGTLTFGHISLETVRIGDKAYSIGQRLQEPMRGVLENCCLCNDAQIASNGSGHHVNGSPTDSCLVRAALDSGIDVRALRRRLPRIAVRHRTETSRFMATQHAVTDGVVTAMKGSPDEVLARCTTEILADGSERPLTPARRRAIEEENLEMASQALRVLGVARKQAKDAGANGADLHDLAWLGLIGMADPVRPGVRRLMSRLHEAGIHTIMLTGDQKATAVAVAKQVGLNGSTSLDIVDSAEIDSMSPEQFLEAARRAQAFSRVNPAQKLRLVRSLQEAGIRVAMVGDGVNDGPALKAADIGIAMGQDSTSAAREIADVIIDGADLDGLVPAVETGRTTHRNVRKAIRYLVSTNLSEVFLVLAGTGIGMSAPLTPMQLLWINMMTDVLPGIGLAMEPAQPDVLRRPPGMSESQILPAADIAGLVQQATIMGGASMAAGLFGASRYGLNSPRARTMSFASLTLSQLLHAVTSRSASDSIFGRRSLPPNHTLWLILAGSIGLQAASLFVPLIRRGLGVAPLTALDSAVTLAGGTLPFLLMEWLKSRRQTGKGELTWTRDTTDTVSAAEAAALPRAQPGRYRPSVRRAKRGETAHA